MERACPLVMDPAAPTTTDQPDRPRARVFLVGYYGVDNLGDDAIFMAIDAEARRLGVEITNFATRGPSRDRRAVPVSGFGLNRYLRAILRADRVVLGGGGILKDESIRLPLELLATAVAARLVRKPVALLAVGVGPFYGRAGRWFASAVARLASIRTVRDDASAELLASLGVGDVVVGADPIFTMVTNGTGGRSDRTAGKVEDAALVVAGRSSHGPTSPRHLVVALRPWFLGPDAARAPRRAVHRHTVAAAIRPVLDAGWRVTFAGLHWPRDRDEAQHLASESGFDGRVTILGEPLDWPSLLALVGTADLVLAMRYHAVAAAAIAGTPVVALAYEPKVSSLALDIGIPLVSVDDPSVAQRLAEAVARAADPMQGARAGVPSAVAVERLAGRARAAAEAALTGRRPAPLAD